MVQVDLGGGFNSIGRGRKKGDQWGRAERWVQGAYVKLLTLCNATGKKGRGGNARVREGCCLTRIRRQRDEGYLPEEEKKKEGGKRLSSTRVSGLQTVGGQITNKSSFTRRKN